MRNYCQIPNTLAKVLFLLSIGLFSTACQDKSTNHGQEDDGLSDGDEMILDDDDDGLPGLDGDVGDDDDDDDVPDGDVPDGDVEEDILDGDEDGDTSDGDEETCDGCLIEGSCVPSRQEHQESACALCDPERDVNGWSPKLQGTECRGAAGVCDVAEVCDGVSNDCPADGFFPDTEVCRGAVGLCDAVETCTGFAAYCPRDRILSASMRCRSAGGVCDVAEFCDGVSNDCPADEKATTECRGSAGVCDVAEFCDGVSNDCPADEKATTECRGSAGVCDVAEVCDGVSNDCPADGFVMLGTVCETTNQCDGEGNCLDCTDASGCADLTFGERAEACTERVCGEGNLCAFNDAPTGTGCGSDDQCEDGICADCTDASGCADLADDGNACTDKTCDNHACGNVNDDMNACDLGYTCTNDHCVDGTCLVESITTGCWIGDVCVEEGFSQDADGCIACDPAASQTAWTNMDGAACAVTDDGNRCTDNVCAEGACIVQNDNNNTCADEIGCTNTTCNGGSCVVSGTNTGCYIDNACYEQNVRKAATGNDSCRACNQATTWNAWTTLTSGTCDDGNACTYNDACTSGGSCAGTAYTCDSPHALACKGDGTCECDNANMNEDCSACAEEYWNYPTCILEGTFPEGYCETSQCWPVPPTNQPACYHESASIECPTGVPAACSQSTPENFCGQDIQYQDNARFFTCYNAAGVETPCESLTTAGEDEVVTDSLIGLMWQRTWATNKTWQQALDYCDTLTYGGHSDWRLPNAHELRSLVDYGRSGPSINTTVFPGTPSSTFWSSSTYVSGTGYAWSVGFNLGYVSNFYKPGYGNARCVREGPVESGIGSLDPFVISGEAGAEIVTDLVTGLVWQKTYAGEITWQQALANCEGLTYAGQSDWRLPNVNELASLANYNRYGPASDFPDMPSSWFWSSSTYVDSTDGAWGVYFGNGSVNGGYKPDSSDARCVREGP